jgi:cytoskeletal protein RodZ
MVFVQKRFVFALALALALTASAAFAATNAASADKTEKKNAAAAAIEKITGTTKPAASKTEASKPVNKTETAKPATHESAKTASLDAMIAQKLKEKENGGSAAVSKPAAPKTEVPNLAFPNRCKRSKP